MKVSILLGPGETEADAEETLLKALNSQRDGGAHSHDRFPDPAMDHAATTVEKAYSKMMEQVMDEIIEVLENAD